MCWRNMSRTGKEACPIPVVHRIKDEGCHSEYPRALGALIEPRKNNEVAVARMQSGIPHSPFPDSAEPVLSAVEGLHPGYTPHDRFVHEQPERSEGEESRPTSD
jgi:hypothetical protein